MADPISWPSEDLNLGLHCFSLTRDPLHHTFSVCLRHYTFSGLGSWPAVGQVCIWADLCTGLPCSRDNDLDCPLS